MRYVKFDDAGCALEERQIDDVADLADVLRKATYQDWLEGLGQPSCFYDLQTWRAIGKWLGEWNDRRPVYESSSKSR